MLALRLIAAFRRLARSRGTIRRDVSPIRVLAYGATAVTAATEVAVVYEAASTAEPEGVELRMQTHSNQPFEITLRTHERRSAYFASFAQEFDVGRRRASV